MTLPPRLASLVVKDGVSLGLLGEADRSLALALAATAIATGQEHREADMNRILESWLEGPGAMLRTDHVELRRWLVDSGFVSRDGFGRAYVRGESERARADALLGDASGPELANAVAALRTDRAREREARRQAFAIR
ncbi:MAG: DUF2087 domain-containing protein [Caldimonas sp.]